MTIKKIKILFIALLLIPLLQSGSKANQLFPDLPGWLREKTEEKQIYSSNGLLGHWSKTTFTQNKGNGHVDITVLSGKGFGSLKISQDISCDDRPVGTGATYKTFFIAGHPAVSEVYPYVGIALSLAIQKDLIIIFETNSMKENELTKFAEKALKSLPN